MFYDKLLEQDKFPDFLIRMGIRRLLKQRLTDEKQLSSKAYTLSLVEELKNSPIAIHTKAANEQHYEVPTEFYQYCLGKHLKYSSGFWKEGVQDLETSEKEMLELTCERAELAENQNVLELGCGWGSLSLFMSAKFPGSKFTVVSNSVTQKIYIDEQAKLRGIINLTVITKDINDFSIEEKYDRIVSVEMFEHLRNYQMLFNKLASFLKDDGKMFVHIFTHKIYTYKFEVKDESDWMSKYFFTGGIMPSNDLFSYFTDDLTISKQWVVNGTHYSKTSEAWLKNMDRNRDKIMPLFQKTYGPEEALKWWVYWRIFYMACAELWGYNKGEEWMVCHYLFTKNVCGN
ncbi:MAG: class I SAM-dependent methyltransferase [Bacteroidetes bacterium]|nr:class I SAM-dependent methyltransferase [Bacteroidota bacterium]